MQPSPFLAGLVLGVLVVIGTSVWVWHDADTHKIPISDSKPYSVNTGAWAWFGTCVVLWIVGFPYYLSRRSQVLGQRARAHEAPRNFQAPASASLAKPGAYCMRCGAAVIHGAAFCHACGATTVIPLR